MVARGLVNDSTGYSVCANTTTGQIATSTTACGASSAQFKKNIEDITYGLDAVMQLRAVSFDYKDSYIQDGPSQLGFIAEEVDLVIPELVARDIDGNIKGLDYPKFTSVLVKAIQEMNLNLATIASTTASSTPESESFATSFFTSVFAKLTQWFESAENGIANLFVGSVKARDTVCVGETCVTEDQLKALLEMAGNQNAPAGGGEEPPAEEPPVEEPPAEEPPAEEPPTDEPPPAEDPPAEEPPAEEPPAEEPPTDGGGETAGAGAGEPGV
jgi:hypothetical protein